MENVILVIHLLLALSLIGLILLQRSEGGGLGIGGGGGGMGSFATAGQTANALTRATAFCAAGFFTTSLILAILAGSHHSSGGILDSLDNPPAIVDTKAPEGEAVKGSSMPTNEHSSAKDAAPADAPKVDEKDKAAGPSAPISE